MHVTGERNRGHVERGTERSERAGERVADRRGVAQSPAALRETRAGGFRLGDHRIGHADEERTPVTLCGSEQVWRLLGHDSPQRTLEERVRRGLAVRPEALRDHAPYRPSGTLAKITY